MTGRALVEVLHATVSLGTLLLLGALAYTLGVVTTAWSVASKRREDEMRAALTPRAGQ